MATTPETAKRIEEIIARQNQKRGIPAPKSPTAYKDMPEEKKQRIRERRMARYYAKPMTPEKRKADSERAAAWAKANPDRAKRSGTLYRIRHREQINARRKTESPEKKALRNQRVYEFYRKYPWVKHWQSADQRCNNPKASGYEHYGGRGIKLLMTKADFQFLWFRDNAAAMQRPSIDRRMNDGDYTLENCRFVEGWFNSKKALFDRRERQAQNDARAREADGQKSAESHLTSNDVK